MKDLPKKSSPITRSVKEFHQVGFKFTDLKVQDKTDIDVAVLFYIHKMWNKDDDDENLFDYAAILLSREAILLRQII